MAMPPELDRFQKGYSYNGFVVTKSMPISEIQCHLTELVHETSGASVLHLASDDPENLFCLSFRTLPNSSNGVAHILEHTVLAGSKKYPVKDPFFSMMRRSLNTFMNALTGQDFTCYPAASQVEKDFYNLLEVYLDAVFHPLLSELSFAQEGIRLEFSHPDDPTSSLEFKGVVYNEMKGALIAPMTRLHEAIQATLFPNSPYGYNSGGDPRDIPALTHAELLSFHRKHYHPGHCLFFFYGNMPLTTHLDFIATHALNGVSRPPPLSAPPKQTRFSSSTAQELLYPVMDQKEGPQEGSLIAFSWLTCSILDQLSVLALSVLDIVLMETDASILKRELLRSRLCRQALSMLETEFDEIPYSIILKGCAPHDADALQQIIFSTLRKIASDGLPERALESALHQLELFRSEIGGEQMPFGLTLFCRSGLLQQHGGNPEDGLTIHALFEELREKLLHHPLFLRSLITRSFLDNPHFAKLVMQPSPTLQEEERAEERARLDTIAKDILPKAGPAIIQRAKDLFAYQEAVPKNIDLLPKLSLQDIPKKGRDFPLTHHFSGSGNIEVFHHHAFTNHITYVDLVFPMPHVREDELWLVRLFANLLPQVGAGLRSYADNLAYIQEHTGGLFTACSLDTQATSAHQFGPSFHIKGKALYRKQAELHRLLFDTATSCNFTDTERLKELILKHFINLESTFNQSGLKYILSRTSSAMNAPARISEAWFGLEYYRGVRALAEAIDSRLDWLIESMQRMAQYLLCTEGAHLVITSDQEALMRNLETDFHGLTDLPQHAYTPWKTDYALPPEQHVGISMASPVAFTCSVRQALPYAHPDAPFLSLATSLLDHRVLHKRVREQGGAYGAGAVANHAHALFYLYSYRDPHIASTFRIFDEAIETIRRGDFSDSDLEEAKFEIMQHLDAPVSPAARAEVAYGWWRAGKTTDMRHAFRKTTLAAAKEQIIEAVERHLAVGQEGTLMGACGDKKLLEKENKRLRENGYPCLMVEKP